MRVSSLEKQDDNWLNSCDYTSGREGGGWEVVILYMAYIGMLGLKAIPSSQAFC